jgi:SAM-dependent methyltransferase
MTTRSRKNDLELEAGTTAHYENPAYYTKTYKTRLDDVRYYVDLARARSGPVLEYGCGNGRITIPLARTGTDVVGLDRSAEMLADLKARLKLEDDRVSNRVTLKRADMRRAKLRQRFPLVFCPFNAFLHLYTRQDVEQFLARVLEHLTPRGQFVFDVSMPEPEELARDPNRAYHTPRFRYPSEDGKSETLVRYSERFDYDKLRQLLFVAMEFSPVDGGEAWMTPLAHRQFYPQELEALLHYNGFEIETFAGDFMGSPVATHSSTLLIHARAKSSRRR